MRRIVEDHLRKNAGGPYSLEIAEWGKSWPVTTTPTDFGRERPPGVVVLLSWRSRTPFGGKVFQKKLFIVQNGKVRGSFGTSQEERLELAVRADRVDGKSWILDGWDD